MIYVNAKQDTIFTEFIHQYPTQDRLHVPFITPKLCGVKSMFFYTVYFLIGIKRIYFIWVSVLLMALFLTGGNVGRVSRREQPGQSSVAACDRCCRTTVEWSAAQQQWGGGQTSNAARAPGAARLATRDHHSTVVCSQPWPLPRLRQHLLTRWTIRCIVWLNSNFYSYFVIK